MKYLIISLLILGLTYHLKLTAQCNPYSHYDFETHKFTFETKEDSLFCAIGVEDYDGKFGAMHLAKELSTEFLIRQFNSKEHWKVVKATIVAKYKKDMALIPHWKALLNQTDEAIIKEAIKGLSSLDNEATYEILNSLLKEADKYQHSYTICFILYKILEYSKQSSIEVFDDFARSFNSTNLKHFSSKDLQKKSKEYAEVLEQYHAGDTARKNILKKQLTKSGNIRYWAIERIKEEQYKEFLPYLRKLTHPEDTEMMNGDMLRLRDSLGDTMYSEEEKDFLEGMKNNRGALWNQAPKEVKIKKQKKGKKTQRTFQ